LSESNKSFSDYLLILRRRKWYAAIPAVLIMAVTAATAYLWPPTYRSEATILVEQAEIPSDLVDTIIDDYVERRLEAISRRILVSDNLLRIIRQYDLYEEERARQPVSAVISAMRDDIHREMISTEIINASGSRSESTVAFLVSFDHRQPEVAQRVNNELVTLYLNENIRGRRERATEAATFIREERERVEESISGLAESLAEFKQGNRGMLPDELPYIQQQVARTEQQISDFDRQIQSLKEREIYLQGQLALVDPEADGSGSQSPNAQLRRAEVELAMLRARYGAEHPDVRKLEREVRGLQQVAGTGGGSGALRAERARLAQELDTLRARYTADHPEVRQAERAVASVDAELRAVPENPVRETRTPGNPAYIQLDAQLNAVRSELRAVVGQREAATGRLERLAEQIARGPLVEREYRRLERALSDATSMRDELARKESVARLGQSLETEQKGERFSLIEPPSTPAAPIKPDRRAVVLVGLVLALGTGLGVLALAEAMDDRIYSAKDLNEMFGEAPLAVVPRIVNREDQVRLWRWRGAAAAVAVVLIAAAVWVVHTRLMPLDFAWYDLRRDAVSKVEALFPRPPEAAPLEAR
jgi:succinoglycan biosynthesis transport protein ExoP